MVTDDTWLTVPETARLFRIDPTTLYRKLWDGTCPFRHIRIGNSWRINADDVHAYLNGDDDAA